MTLYQGFIFTADWHFGLKRYASKKLEEDRYNTAKKIVDEAIKNSLCIINAGDVLDVNLPNSKAFAELVKIHKELEAAKIPMFLIEGNHDTATPSWYSQFTKPSFWKNGGIVELNALLPPISVELKTSSNPIKVCGAGYCDEQQLLSHFNAFPANYCDIFVAHVSVKEWVGGGSKGAALTDFKDGVCPFVVIGDTHIHKKDIVGSTTFISPGTLDACKFGEPETPKYWQFTSTTTHCGVSSKTIESRKVVTLNWENASEAEKINAKTAVEKNSTLLHLIYDINNASEVNAFWSGISDKELVRKKPYDPESETDAVFVAGNISDDVTLLQVFDEEYKHLSEEEKNVIRNLLQNLNADTKAIIKDHYDSRVAVEAEKRRSTSAAS